MNTRPATRTLVVHILLVIAISWVIYLNALDNDFTNWDDPDTVIHNAAIRSLSGSAVSQILTPDEAGTSGIPGVYRPVWTLSYAWDYFVGELNPAFYHAHSVLLHSLNSALVYLLSLALGLATLPALVTALLFAVHPIHVEAVTWVSGRNELLMTLFFLIAFLLAAFRARLGNGIRPGAYILSIVVLAFALLSKATAAVFPLLLAVTYLWFLGPDREGRRNPRLWLLRHVPYLILSAVLVWAELWVSRAGVVVRPEEAESRWITLLTVPKLILTYLGSLLIPLGLAPRYDVSYVMGFSEEVGMTILGLAVIVALAVWMGRRFRTFGFASWWFALTLLPASNIVLLTSLRADRFLYLPSVGFCLAAGVLLHHTWGPEKSGRRAGKIIAVLLCGTLVFFSVVTLGQNQVWQNSISLWEKTTARSPGDYMAHHNLGSAYFEAGRMNEAAAALETSVALNPEFAKAHNNLGRVYAALGREENAERHLRWAIDLQPDYASAFANLGVLYAQQKRYPEASRSLKHAIRLDPGRAERHLNLAQIYVQTGKLDEAEQEIRAAIDAGLAPEWEQRARELLESISERQRDMVEWP
jgi:tetratricopeptide (TPR) repeat protein